MTFKQKERVVTIDYVVTGVEPMVRPYTGGQELLPTAVLVRFLDRQLVSVWVSGRHIGVKGQVTKRAASTPMSIETREDLDQPEIPAWLKELVLVEMDKEMGHAEA